MAGRNKKSRAAGRGALHNHQKQNQASDDCNLLPRPFNDLNRDGHCKRYAQTQNPSSGIRHLSDNSDPILSAKFRKLKRQSDMVKRRLEELTAEIDELQPDSTAMDWSGSAGTVVYIPVPSAADRSFHHPDVRSTSTGDWPSHPDAFKPAVQHPGVTFDGSLPRLGPTKLLRPMTRPDQTICATRNDGINVHTTAQTHTRDSAGKQVAVTMEEDAMKRQMQVLLQLQPNQIRGGSKTEIVNNPPLEMQYRGVSNPGCVRTNYQRPTASTLMTPPPSPRGLRINGRRESWAV